MNSRPKGLWDFIFAVSVVGILVAGYFAFFAPKPKVVKAKSLSVQLQEAQSEAGFLAQRTETEESALTSKTWNTSHEALGSEVLALVTRLSGKHGLQVSDFRSGRLIRAANLMEATFSVVLEGPFPSVMAALTTLERPDSKLAVSQLKLTSKGDADQVLANIGLTGFILGEGKKNG